MSVFAVFGPNHFVRFYTLFGAEMTKSLQNTVQSKDKKITGSSSFSSYLRVFTHSLAEVCRLSGVHNHFKVQDRP